MSSHSTHLLLFTLGPVQSFISAARTTRDLWSGSYLLSYLSAHAIKVLVEAPCRATIIFPATPPPLDHKDLTAYLTPTLPNRILCEVPASYDPDTLKQDLKNKFKTIAEAVLTHLQDQSALKPFLKTQTINKAKFDQQIDQFLEVHYVSIPSDLSTSDLIPLLGQLPPCEQSEKEQRRQLYRQDPTSPTPWEIQSDLIQFLLNGTKSLHAFDANRSGKWDCGENLRPDHLDGHLESILQVGPEDCKNGGDLPTASAKAGYSRIAFTPNEKLSAPTLVKRLWDSTYLSLDILKDALDAQPLLENNNNHRADTLRRLLPMPNTHLMAKGEANQNDSGDDDEFLKPNLAETQNELYFAVLAMDGDHIGQWISGARGELTQQKHKTFSQALNTYASIKVRNIVQSCKGTLIYAGGDDVLAMLPAHRAVSCAEKLRKQFRDSMNSATQDISKSSEIDASAGIAIAHYKTPLQDVIHTAHLAEKRAKAKLENGGLGRASVAVSIVKHAGSTIEWGAPWESQGLRAFQELLKKMSPSPTDASPEVKQSFCKKLEAQLLPYRNDTPATQDHSQFPANFACLLEQELNYCLHHNQDSKLSTSDSTLIFNYWTELEALPFLSFTSRLDRFLDLLRTAAWFARSHHASNPTLSSHSSDAL